MTRREYLRRVDVKTYYVYIMTNRSGTLYTGVTGDLERRVYEHKHGVGSRFTAKYRIDKLLHFEVFSDIWDAIAREKQIKGWLRARKIALIESVNPNWADLSADWYGPTQPSSGDGSSAP
jgi:putative endonuclease